MDTYPQKAYLHALRQLPGLNYKQLRLLAEYFNYDFEAIYGAEVHKLVSSGIAIDIANQIHQLQQTFDIPESLKALENNNIDIISCVDPNYPILLKNIMDSPLLLYYRGTLGNFNDLCLAVVGSRKMSNYGKAVSNQITKELVEQGIVIVSGLAYGIDACAHQATVEMNKRTIAVVASGLKNEDLYPKDHINLANKIIDNNGLLISEYPPGTPALKQHFIARNRIISGLSIGTLVVECSEKSGALITARYALDQNRSVYAIPGSIYNPASSGPNLLIKQGAVVVTSSEDIFADLNIQPKKPKLSEDNFNKIEKQIIISLNQQPMQINELINHLNLNLQQINPALTMLEIRGWISKNHHGAYEIIKNQVSN